MDYDELVQKNIAGEICDLEFLLAQEELAQAYQEEMAAKQQEINNQTAREWLLDYEEKKLYEGHTRTEIYTNKSWIQQVTKHYSVSPN